MRAYRSLSILMTAAAILQMLPIAAKAEPADEATLYDENGYAVDTCIEDMRQNKELLKGNVRALGYIMLTQGKSSQNIAYCLENQMHMLITPYPVQGAIFMHKDGTTGFSPLPHAHKMTLDSCEELIQNHKLVPAGRFHY